MAIGSSSSNLKIIYMEIVAKDTEHHDPQPTVLFSMKEQLGGFINTNNTQNNPRQHNPIRNVHSKEPSGGTLVAHVIGLGSDIAIAAQKPMTKLDNTSHPKDGHATVNPITTYVESTLPPVRKLYLSSVDIFTTFHNRQNEDQEQRLLEVCHASRQYRSALSQCIIECEKLPNAESSSIEMLKIILALWHLIELLAFTHEQQNNNTKSLAAWIVEHYASDQMESHKSIFEDLVSGKSIVTDSFWDTVFFFTRTGQRSFAIDLLEIHPERNLPEKASTFSNVISLLRNNDHHHHNSSDHVLRSDKNLSTVVEMLCGNPKVLKSYCPQWFDFLAAQLLYFLPNQNDQSHLLRMMVSCISEYGRKTSPFDLTVMAILEVDMATALTEVHNYGNNWATAHLSDLLVSAGHLPQSNVFMLEYVSETLAPLKGMWTIVPHYIKCEDVIGKEVLYAILDREHPSSDYKARKLISIASTFQFESLVSSIKLRRASEWISKKFYAAGISWLNEDAQRNSRKVESICKTLLEKFITDGKVSYLHAVVESLNGDTPLLAQMKFLTLYRELVLVLEDVANYEYYHKQEDLREATAFAIDLFIQIFSQTDIPEKFYKDLLVRVLPFLAHFDSTQCYTLMKSINLYNNPTELLHKVRVALSQSLSNNLVSTSNSTSNPSHDEALLDLLISSSS